MRILQSRTPADSLALHRKQPDCLRLATLSRGNGSRHMAMSDCVFVREEHFEKYAMPQDDKLGARPGPRTDPTSQCGSSELEPR